MTETPQSGFNFTPDTGGLVLVDKPLTWTSFNVVAKVRGAMRIAVGRKMKVGHAGTLDPLASGLLILAYGPFTKKLPHITGEHKTYLVPLSKHILVQENDFIKAGQPLSDGSIAPGDILNIQGPTRVQEYLVDEVQEVYRMQGVKINDKHFEVIVRQMMRKVEIEDPGDTRFLEKQAVNKAEFMEENDQIYDKVVITDAGESEFMKVGQIISSRKLRDENSVLRRKDLKLVEARQAHPATAHTLLQGITRASLQTESFMSAASFQETTKVLNEAAVNAKEDHLLGLKENVIVGHLIPAGTGTRRFQKDVVYNKDEYTRIMAQKLEAQEIDE